MPEKKEFYSNINIDGIADADYMEAKRVGKDFERKNLGEYHNLYLKDDILLLAVFENFREMCLNIYHLDPAKILSAPGFEWQAENTEVKLKLLTDIGLPLMVEKRIRGGYAMQFIDMQKLIINI